MIDFDAAEVPESSSSRMAFFSVCSCEVVVLVYDVGGVLKAWDPDLTQRKLIRRVDPKMVAENGFGWKFGARHECCPEGTRPIDALRIERKGRGVAS